MVSNIDKYIIEATDLELISKDRILIITTKERIILNGLNSQFIDKCFEVFGKKFRKNNYKKTNYLEVFWSNDEIEYLRVNYLKKEMEDIGMIINKSNYQINLMLVKLKLLVKREWSNEELEFLKDNIESSTIWLAEKLNRSVSSIKSKKRVLKLSKI